MKRHGNLLSMANQEILSITYGLASAASWGAGDFSGGYVTKTGSVFGVIFVGNIVSVALLVFTSLWLGSPIPGIDSLVAGALFGVCSVFGLTALYKGLAIGRMGVVAPLAAVVTAAIPVIFGTFIEGLPSNFQLIGFLFAFAAIWLLSASEKAMKIKYQGLRLPVAAGLCFGLSFILIDYAAEQSILWPIAMAKSVGAVILFIFIILFKTGEIPSKHRFPMAALAGILEAGGNVFYALASQIGRLDISAVLASMYPGMTIMLAWLFLKESISRWQWIGVIGALLAIALISA